MNRWAAALAQSPPTLLRLIAATHRVSLPRRCPPEERLARLRAALCRPAALRALYWALDPAERDALQALRACAGGLRPETLAARFGPIRPLNQLRADPAPRSLSERLLLLGLLLPRPAAPFHPPRYLVPPEVRAWLPAPLPPASPPPDPAVAEPPVLAAVTALLLAAAERPLPARQDGRLTAAARRALAARLEPLAPDEAAALCDWTLPLLLALGALARDRAALTLGPAAPRLLALPPAERLARLRAAWEALPRPDAWLVALRVRLRGLDAPALRRRLLAWAAHVPPEAAEQPDRAYARMAAALGPLADGVTHCLSGPSRRGPWTARRAAAVWGAACAGPLRWLGALPGATSGTVEVWRCGGVEVDADRTRCSHGTQPAMHADVPLAEPGDNLCMSRRLPISTTPPQLPTSTVLHLHSSPPSHLNSSLPPHLPTSPPPQLHTSTPPHLHTSAPSVWTWTPDGRLHLPRRADLLEALAVAAFGHWEASTATTLVYRLGPAEAAAAISRGHDPARLALTLARRGGAPASLAETLRAAGGLRLARRTVLLSDDPEDLARALRRSRAARRALEAQLAPGVALVAPGRERALARALARIGRAVPAPPEERPASGAAPEGLTPAERAGLLAAARFYAAAAPPGAPLPPLAATLAKLRAGLPPALAADSIVEVWRCGSVEVDNDLKSCSDGNQLAMQADAPVAEPGGDLCISLRLDSSTPPQLHTHTSTPPHLHTSTPPAGALRETLRRALRRRGVVRLWYQGAHDATPRERMVRPLRLEEHGPVTYLHAYCLTARAERCFRLDRVAVIADAVERSAPPRRPRGRRRSVGPPAAATGRLA
ncbi:MAG: WYL domain-containing protein, partial [Chloroflexaceae bacterium]|nr:WYL domain-containing protein [Chloroflexaceae bacterium]